MTRYARRFAQLTAGGVLAASSLMTSACVAPVGPVEVTRFHAPDMARLGHGTIAVEPAPGQPDTLEFRAYAAAVLHELQRAGYTAPPPGTAPSEQVAFLTLDRQTFRPERRRSPVTVGGAGSVGSYGSGAGLGLAIDLSGPPKDQVATRMFVSIRDRAAPPSATALWEGRAVFAARADSPLAGTSLGSAKTAEALFKGFPGESGQTIQVK